jgi:hypothetical protein
MRYQSLKNCALAAKSATMPRDALTGVRFMTAVRNQIITENDDQIFNDADELIALAQHSFTKAAQAAVSENDRLGIPTHGSVGGKLIVRQPPKVTILDQQL